jgi:hypothetical protein
MKNGKVFNVKCMVGIVIAFLSQQAYGQHQVEKPMTEQQKSTDTVEVTAEGLKVIQSGNENRVEVTQSAGKSSVKTGTTTTVVERKGNRVVYTSDADSSNHTRVQQSGSGNSVVVRQNGGGNTVRVRQSPGTKKED